MGWIMGRGRRREADFWVYYGFLFLLLDLFIDRSDLPERPVFSGGIDVLYCIDWIGMMSFVLARIVR